MSYEVVKEIRGHRYRYTVESYRDPDTGKVKNRWTYAGRADDQPSASRTRRKSRAATREAIVEAFLKLIERKPLRDVTVSGLSETAKITNATFYRHFASRDDVVSECTRRANAELELRLHDLDAIASSAGEERARLRRIAVDLVRRPPASPGLYRAWSALAPEKIREARHQQRIAAFTRYISDLQERGYISKDGVPRRLAIALSMIVQTFTRRSVIENRLLSEEDYAVVGDVFERLIFLSQQLT
jgi:AcrR family transcriptional regulator